MIISRINGFTYVQTEFDYFTGELKIKKVELDPEKIDLDDIHELERWIENAMRDGYAKAQEIATDKMKPLMGALGNFGM